jgi:hypothetical protein
MSPSPEPPDNSRSKPSFCIRSYAYIKRYILCIDIHGPDQVPFLELSDAEVETELKSFDEDVLFHPHRKGDSVLKELGSRSGWDQVARESGKLEAIEWDVVKDQEDRWEIATFRWNVDRRRQEDVKLVLDRDALSYCDPSTFCDCLSESLAEQWDWT